VLSSHVCILAAQVLKAVKRILHEAQKKCGVWVGSSVVHLGDDNVPNALHFIDKYNQVCVCKLYIYIYNGMCVCVCVCVKY
jgi:hypothetical protein